jgi:putative transposase
MRERAYRYRFYPTEEQEQLLRRTLGCVRLVYNKALHTRTEGWYERQERIDYKQTSGMLTQWKKQEDLQFLNEVSSVPLQQGLRTCKKLTTFGQVVQVPQLKRNEVAAALSLPFAFVEGRQLWLANVPNLAYPWSRTLPKVRTSTVT